MVLRRAGHKPRAAARDRMPLACAAPTTATNLVAECSWARATIAWYIASSREAAMASWSRGTTYNSVASMIDVITTPRSCFATIPVPSAAPSAPRPKSKSTNAKTLPAQSAERMNATQVRRRKLIAWSTTPPRRSIVPRAGKNSSHKRRGSASHASAESRRLQGVGIKAAASRLQSLSMSTSMHAHGTARALASSSAIVNSAPTSTLNHSMMR
mmetsp:Transcript_79275/g.220398  ORF Transcript_79275/g.220398 Transcript_79275/m.220398 type:complete len:213 (-) Transcript_79275:151-789(-)